MKMSEDITANVKGGKLIIEVDVSPETVKNAPMSKSGKNKLVASTRGTMKVGQFSIGLNVTTK
jgi:hypothetical protein